MPGRARSGSSSEDSPEDTSSAKESEAASPAATESEAKATPPASPSPEADAASSAIAESAGHASDAVSDTSQASSAQASSDAGASSSEAASEEETSSDSKSSEAETGDGSLSDAGENEEEPRSERRSAPESKEVDADDSSAAESASSNSNSASTEKTGKEKKGQGPVEQFEPHLGFESLDEDIAKHDYPKNIATCGPCLFWRHRIEWSAECAYTNPVTSKKESWLGCRNGMAICIPCNSYWGQSGVRGVGRKSSVARGTGTFTRLQNLRRHGTALGHAQALQAWGHRLRAQAAQGAGEAVVSTFASSPAASATGAQAATSADAVSVKTRDPTAAYRAVVAARTLLETHGSFHSYTKWRDAVASEAHRQALNSEWHCRQLVQSMARYERLLTFNLLKEGAVFRLQADGLERTYQVEIGTVLWALLACLQHLPAHGEPSGWAQALGPRGPWIFERIIGCHEFPRAWMKTARSLCWRRACAARALAATGK